MWQDEASQEAAKNKRKHDESVGKASKTAAEINMYKWEKFAWETGKSSYNWHYNENAFGCLPLVRLLVCVFVCLFVGKQWFNANARKQK